MIISRYIKNQDIQIYVADCWPNGWTDWADIFMETNGWRWGVVGGVL